MAADNAVPYALVSPAVADKLKGEAATSAAQHIIKTADAALAQIPNPMPLVHTEGTLPHQGIFDQSALAQKDWPLMLNFAMAYRLTGDPRYLQATEKFLNAWLDVYKVSFNPIDETNLDNMIVAYDLVRPGLSKETQDKMTVFLRTMAEGYLDKIAQQKKEDVANWQSHRIKLIVLSAYALGDEVLIAKAKAAFFRQVSVNINPDGTVVDFPKRDALHYVTYDLEPLTMASLAAKAHGHEWFGRAASDEHPVAVVMAVDWLTPYALGQQTHEEFVHSSVPFDAARAKAGLKGYSGPWEPGTSAHLYQLAALADPKYAATFQQVCAANHRNPIDWLVLLNGAGF